jgi:hypothetical protein
MSREHHNTEVRNNKLNIADWVGGLWWLRSNRLKNCYRWFDQRMKGCQVVPKEESDSSMKTKDARVSKY